MSRRLAFWLTAALLALTLLFRVAGPSDIDDNNQPGPLSHILDVAVNGHMLLQHDPAGRLATKPPLYPWLGAAGVAVTGSTDEWALKLPLLAATLVITLVVFDLAHRKAGPWAALIAAAAWITNFHVMKLCYTARTDMLVSMWIAVALWSVEVQCAGWRARNSSDNERRSSLALIALFWLCVAAGALTKGPAVLLPILWLAGRIVVAKRWRGSRLGWQVAGLVLCLGLVAAWIVPTVSHYPEYRETVRAEVADRTTGQGTGAHRSTPMIAVPLYFVRSFAPWSIAASAVVLAALTALGRAVAWRQSNRLAALRAWWRVRQIGWPAWWVLLVIVFFAIPQGRRADYLVPAYVGGAVAVGWLVVLAQSRADGWRVLVHLLFGAMTILGIALGAAWPWLRTRVAPGATLQAMDVTAHVGGQYPAMLLLACGLSLVAGVLGLWWTHRRAYQPAAIATAFVMVGLLAVFNLTFSRSARKPGGDEVIAITRLTEQVSRDMNLPVVFYETGNVPVQALLGRNEPMDAEALRRADRGALVLTSHVGLSDVETSYLLRTEQLAATRPLEESRRVLYLVLVRPRD